MTVMLNVVLRQEGGYITSWTKQKFTLTYVEGVLTERETVLHLTTSWFLSSSPFDHTFSWRKLNKYHNTNIYNNIYEAMSVA